MGNIKYAPEKLSSIVKDIEGFLIEPLEAISKGEEFTKAWESPGPWG